MFECKSLTDFTKIFSPNNFKKNYDIIGITKTMLSYCLSLKTLQKVIKEF